MSLSRSLAPRALARGVLLTASLLTVTPQIALGARWFDNLPADDPDIVVRRNSTSPAPEKPDVFQRPDTSAQASGLSTVAQAAGTVVGTAYTLTAGLVGSVVGGIGAVASGTSQALWETAYMFGVNRTPVPRAAITDAIPDLKPAANDVTEPVTPAPAVKPAPVIAKAEPTPVVPSRTAAAAEPTPKEIDPGLLANFIFDRGERRPDGSFFVPKSLQRLFEVRTTATAAADVPVTLKLAGRIVPDPQQEGAVEASFIGRIEPPPSGLPVLGDTVRKGQLLGYVTPAVGVVDRTQVRREVARLTTDIRVETENLEILKQFSFVPFRDGKIYQSEQRLAGLRRERDALLPLLQTQEALRAPTDGVISSSTAIAGRIVHPGEKIFGIVNPNLLWIEAVAPDPTMAQNAQAVAKATATTPEGQVLDLTFVGSGLALEQQSTPILFRINNPPAGLRVGRPVGVAVQSENRSQHGLPVTRDAITIGSDGVQEVWEQSAPEVFLPHVVRTTDLDGGNVLIVDGLKEGSRVVVNGVRLLAQLQ